MSLETPLIVRFGGSVENNSLHPLHSTLVFDIEIYRIESLRVQNDDMINSLGHSP